MDINFIQQNKWTFDNVKLIIQRNFDLTEDQYAGIEFLGFDKVFWFDKETSHSIFEWLKENNIDIEKEKEDVLYDFDCICAEGIASYNRHGEGRCDGCHGRIFK